MTIKIYKLKYYGTEPLSKSDYLSQKREEDLKKIDIDQDFIDSAWECYHARRKI